MKETTSKTKTTMVKDGVLLRQDPVAAIKAKMDAALAARGLPALVIPNQTSSQAPTQPPTPAAAPVTARRVGGTKMIDVDWRKVGFGTRPLAEIAAEIGCSESTAHKHQKRLGLPRYRPPREEMVARGKKSVESRRAAKKAAEEALAKAAASTAPIPTAAPKKPAPLTASFFIRIDVDILGAPAEVFRAMASLHAAAAQGIAGVAIEPAPGDEIAIRMLPHMRGEV